MSLTKVSYSMISGAPANVLDFGADPTGVIDSTAAINAAIATGRRVRMPAGTYLGNVTINNKTIIEGDGSTISVLKPFDNAIAAMTYTFTAMQNPVLGFFQYHSEVRDIGFEGTGTKIGIGFTFGTTVPSAYQANDELANNVKFYGCLFRNLDKGVQFPFGNIGTEFYSCGFKENKYGVYSLNNKFGSPMHAGNKHFYGGEASGNTCAFYINNTADGFGDFSLRDFIIEGNSIGFYCFTNTTYSAVLFDNVWVEANASGSPSAVTIDQWSGSTRSDLVIDVATYIFAGEKSEYIFKGGHFANARIIANTSVVYVDSSRISSDKASSVVGADSQLIFENPVINDTACPQGNGIVAIGMPKFNNTSATGGGSQAAARGLSVPIRKSKSASTGFVGQSVTFNSAEPTTGSFSLTGSLSSDSTLYANSNEFVIPFSSPYAGEFVLFTNSQELLITGFYVFTFHAKWVSGSLPVFYVYDGLGIVSIAQQMTLGNDGAWQAFGGYAYTTGGATVGLWATGTGTSTIRLSAYQIRRFNTQVEAMSFIASLSYIE